MERYNIESIMNDGELNKINGNFVQLFDNLRRTLDTINQLILESGGDSNLEVVQARGGKPVLNERFIDIESQLAEEATQRENAIDYLESKKANKDDVNNQLNDISVYQINKNKGLLDETYFSEEVKQQWTGKAPVNAVPQKNSLVNNQLTEKSVSINKTNFIEVVSDNLFNKNDVMTGNSFSTNTGLPVPSANNNLSGFIPIDQYDYTYYRILRVGYYNDKYEFISYTQANNEEVSEVPPNEAKYNRLVVANSNLNVAQMNKGGEKKEFDEFGVRVKNDFRSNELARVIISSNAPSVPNVNTQDYKLEMYAPFFIVHGKSRIQITADVDVPFDGTGAHQYILYNLKTKQFRAVRSSAERELDDYDLILMVINRKSTHEIINIICNFAYTVDGESLLEKKIYEIIGDTPSPDEINHFSISAEDLIGWYQPNENESYDLFDYDTTTAEELHQEFTALKNQYSDYIIEENLGVDSSGDYDVYRYTLKPEIIDVPNFNKPTPKIIVVGGLHAGTEKASIFSIYYFIKDLCENWQDDPLLEYLRHNVEFVIIPNANPWGFDGGDFRRNYNGVDLNRNFDYNWSEHGEGTNTYTGPYAFSEIEAQYVRNTILDNLDAMFFIDYHTNGSSGDDYESLMWITLGDGPIRNNNASNLSRYHISKATREFIKNYNQPNNEGLFGYTTSGNTSRIARSYASSEGIPAVTLECFRKFPNQEEYHNPEAIKACTEYFGNFLVNVVKEFRVNNARKIGV